MNQRLIDTVNEPQNEPMSEPLRQRRKEARPGELTAAALQLFVEKGFAATRLDDVAKRAGVSKGTLYLYFDSKESLFKAAIQEGLLPVLNNVNDMIDAYVGPMPALMESLVLYWWRTVGNTPLSGIPKLLISEARNFPEVAEFYQREVLDRGHDMLRRALQRGIDAGEFRQLAMEPTIELLFAPLMMLVVWRHSFGACVSDRQHPFHAPEDYLRAHIDMAMNGLLKNSKK